MVLQSFVFLDETSANGTSNPLGNTNGTTLTFEVVDLSIAQSGVSIQVEGKTDSKNDNWTPIAIINRKKLSVLETVIESGNYFAPITGLSSVRVVNNGTVGEVRVYGRITAEV